MKNSKVIPHSGPSKILKHNATRKSEETPYNHFKPVPHSSPMPPYPMSSDRTEMATPHSHFSPTPHSKPDPVKAPKKWHKKGYNMSVPATDAAGQAIADSMKAK